MPRGQRRSLLIGTATVAVSLLLPTAVASAAPSPAASTATAGASAGCPPIVAFDRGNFSHPTRIDNRYLPMTPGTQLVYRGEVSGGQPHTVVFTVTDLTKVVDGVTTRVIYDVDRNGTEVQEAELAFFAQDDQGNVWNLGEYPETFENGKFAGAPDVWLQGLQRAHGGIHMLAHPAQHLGVRYLQGRAPAIDFLDCAKVVGLHDTVTVPAGTFHDVLTTYETSPLASTTAIQTKKHAPGVGIVRIGAINDPEGETLKLVRFGPLGERERERLNTAAVQLDVHGHRVSPLYRQTPPVQRG